MKDYFRDSLQTPLGKAIYDWAPIRKAWLPPEIAKEIAEGFCVREGRKCLQCSFSGVETPYVEISGESSLLLFALWQSAFYDHGYSAPILIFKEDDEA